MKGIFKIGCIGFVGFVLGVVSVMYGVIKYFDEIAVEPFDSDDYSDEFFCDDLDTDE